MRRAEVRDVKPITSLEELAGDPEMIADFDVDEFLHEMRKDRNRV